MKLYTSSKTSEDIYCFDIQKEIERKEDWTNSKEQIKEHTNILLYGGTYDKVEFKGLIDTIFKNKKIVEEIGNTIINDEERTIIYYTIV